MDQRIIQLYDEFTNCHLDRRLFLERLAALVGSMAAALALLPRIESNSIVFNNNCHGAEKAQQQRHYGGRYIVVDLVNPRFDKLAEVYGARGVYVQHADEISDAVKEALASNGPSVIEIPVAEYFPAPAPTPAGAGPPYRGGRHVTPGEA